MRIARAAVAVRARRGAGAERRQRPPRQPAGERRLPDLGQRLIRRRAQVDRRLPAAGGRRPGRVQELLARLDQVDGPTPDQLGIADQHDGVGGQHVDQQLHPVDQRRRQRLHAVDRVALGDLVEHLDQLGMLLGQGGGPRRTSSVSSSSRQGEAMISASVSSLDRWSATEK